MADKASHISKACSDFAFLNECIKVFDVGSKYPAWFIIIEFYTCLQVVDAILASLDVHPDSHENRKRYIAANPKHFDSDFAMSYGELQNQSHKARYVDSKVPKFREEEIGSCDSSFHYILQYARKKYAIEIK